MKHFKKLMAFAVAMVMVVAMAMPAMAADPTSGSVTVEKNYKGQTYTLYKLFDAQITFKEDGTQRAITYTLPTGKTLESPATNWFEVNTNGFVVAKDALNAEVMKSAEYRAWAKSFGTQVGEAKTAASDDDTSVKWEGLTWGYYFVDSTLGAFISVDTDNPDVKVNDKNNPPSVDKEITSAENGDVGDGKDKSAEGDKGKNEGATAQVGDKIGYKLTVSAKPGAENYVVTDTLSDGLTPPAAADVTVACTSPAITPSDYNVTVSGQEIKVVFTKAWLDKITADATITITYEAVLNGNAVVGEGGNDNTVKLTWGHSTDDKINFSEDDADVYTAKVSLIKTDGDSTALAGAEFALKNAAGKYYKKAEDGTVSWVDDVAQATKYTSGADGKLSGEFTGLANGTYTFEETVVPDGYNPIPADDPSLTFTIDEDDYTNDNLIQSATVINNAGSVLPSTGGIGTTIFYIVGAILVLSAGVLLITRRRMSAE